MAMGTLLNKRFNERNNNIIAVHVHLLSSAKQQREMTTLSGECELLSMANFLKFYFNFIAVSQIQFHDSFQLTIINNVKVVAS